MTERVSVAEEYFAKLIAQRHGQTPLYREPGGNLVTVANRSGSGTGWAWEVDNYVERHWRDYLAAARAVIEKR